MLKLYNQEEVDRSEFKASFERGERKGRAEGVLEERARNEVAARRRWARSVADLIQKHHFSQTEALEVLHVPEQEYPAVLALLPSV